MRTPLRRVTWALALAALATLSGTPAAADPATDAVRLLAVQDGGRVKPFDTLARETARAVTGARAFGAETVQGLDPVEWTLAMLGDPEHWKDQPIVKVTHAGLRGAVQLPADRDRFSFRELVAHRGFMTAAEGVHEKLRANVQLDPVEQEIAGLYDTLSTMAGVFSGEGLRMVPIAGEGGAWMSVGTLGHSPAPQAAALRPLFAGVVQAQLEGDRARMATTATELRAALAAAATVPYPSAADLQREIGYNRMKPFRSAWLLYTLAFLCLLASYPLRSRVATGLAVVLAVAGLAINTWGMVLRTLISGRAPVTNMYETVVFVGWGAVLFGLVFAAVYRTRHVLASALPIAVLALIVADAVPILNGSIQPLVPVLRDNLWLTVHVVTIMLGYAALFLAMAIGHVNLAMYFFTPQRKAQLHTMTLFLHRTVQVGTFFLALGTLLGGVWASYSWGRFWGWDPKETWSLIATLGYLALLHGRFLGWFREFGLAVGSLIGFLLVLMAWYGVNYILGTGLHSYGFGSGGYTWIGGFLAFEAVVLGAATWRYLQQHRTGGARLEPAAATR